MHRGINRTPGSRAEPAPTGPHGCLANSSLRIACRSRLCLRSEVAIMHRGVNRTPGPRAEPAPTGPHGCLANSGLRIACRSRLCLRSEVAITHRGVNRTHGSRAEPLLQSQCATRMPARSSDRGVLAEVNHPRRTQHAFGHFRRGELGKDVVGARRLGLVGADGTVQRGVQQHIDRGVIGVLA